MYPDIHFSLFENDSDDDTRSKLESWVAEKYNAHLNIQDGLSERIKDRVDRIAYARNVALSAVNFYKAKMILNVDMDEVFTRPLETKSFVSAMNTLTECDVVTANGHGGYYDIYALRIPEILEYDCWDLYYWLVREQGWEKEKAIYHAIEKWKDFMPTVEKPMEVWSAFNAAALYRADAFEGFVKYNTQDLLGQKVCEHVGMHERMRVNGKRIVFDPNFRV
jgi:glycosyltransferase involved in cell wall biosynthesis